VNEIEVKDLADVGDLIGDAEAKKEIELKSLKKKVVIKKITVGEIADILKVAKENEMQQYLWMVYKGLVKPKLTFDQVKKLKFETLVEIALAIQKFSGLDRESISRLENLLGIKP